MLQFEHDPEADAVYIQIRDVPYSHGRNLDDSRRLDYGPDDLLIGVELLGVSLGVNLDGLPQRGAIKKLLTEHGVKVLANAPGSES